MNGSLLGIPRRPAAWVAVSAALVFATIGRPVAAVAAEAAADADEAVYLKRLAETGSNGRDSYDPLEAVPGVAGYTPLPIADHPALSMATREAARRYALANNSKALLIWHAGFIEAAAFGPATDQATLINSRSMAKPLGAVAVGRAIALGAIRSLDQPAADFVQEWRGSPKAAITLRELLDMTSGLAEQGAIKDPNSVFTRAYLHPRHEAVMVNEYPLTAEPGTRYQYSNTSADLIAVIIERATKRRYAEFVSTEIVQRLGAAGGQVWVDRPGGLAHSGCCILLPAETWMRLGLLLMDDGHWQGRSLLPDGFVTAMRTPSSANSRYGLGVWIEGEYRERRGFGPPDAAFGAVLHGAPYLAKDLFLFDGNADQVLYMIPSRRLAILRMGDAPPRTPEWDNALLPNLVLKDLGSH